MCLHQEIKFLLVEQLTQLRGLLLGVVSRASRRSGEGTRAGDAGALGEGESAFHVWAITPDERDSFGQRIAQVLTDSCTHYIIIIVWMYVCCFCVFLNL